MTWLFTSGGQSVVASASASVLPVNIQGFLGGSERRESDPNAGDPDSSLGLERLPGEGNGNPLQYFCLENSMYGRA